MPETRPARCDPAFSGVEARPGGGVGNRAAMTRGRHRRARAGALAIWLIAVAALLATAPCAGAASEAGGNDPFFTPARVAIAKFAVAFCGSALLLWGIALRRSGRAEAQRRLRDALLLGLGVLGALGWTNFLQFRYAPGYGHPQDLYHYYLGSKYFDELGYTRLYECTTIADAESGLREEASRRSIRNLETYRRESAARFLRDPERCTRHFSARRWKAFKRDVGWFRKRMPDSAWLGALADHGYNPSPVWGILGTTLANTGPVSQAKLSLLLLIDPALVLAMWAAVWWAFGWRAMSVALIFWGTNYPADYLWTGGSYLRNDWLFATVAGLCCLRRGRTTTAGFLLMTAALLRVFPVLLLFGIALKVGASMWRARRLRLSSGERRLAVGCLLAAAILIPLSTATAGGDRAWFEFAQNLRLHVSTPSPNNIGLKTLISYDADARARQARNPAVNPGDAWAFARLEAFPERRILFWGLVLAYLALLARAVAGQEAWVAATLGTGAIIMATEMSCYYFSVMLGFGLLWLRREGIGAALCALSASTSAIAWRWEKLDEIYTWTSLAAVVFVVFATALLARRSGLQRSSAEGRPEWKQPTSRGNGGKNAG